MTSDTGFRQLEAFGWQERHQVHTAQFADTEWVPARVIAEHREHYRLMTDTGERLAEVSGRFRYQGVTREDFPAVGDWVMAADRAQEGQATIQALLPRFSKFSRKAAGETTEEQIVAANVDDVFIVMALNRDFNLRRLERYLTMAWESGANPAIVLTKADLCADPEQVRRETEHVAFGVPILLVSALTGEGLPDLMARCEAGRTVVLLGSSGVGKSTLTNALLGGHRMAVQSIRASDDRGKHTTTHRELMLLPGGGLLIDTPGMRELQLWGAEDGLADTFADVEEFARECQFRDCQHREEPGCGVQAAITDGRLQRSRFDSYLKLQRELAYLARKDDQRLQNEEREKWKKRTQTQRQWSKHR